MKQAYDINIQQGFFDTSNLGVQAAQIAYKSFITSQPGEFSRGILLDNFPAVRKIEVEQMEKSIKGEISVEQAISTIQTEGNKLLEKQLPSKL